MQLIFISLFLCVYSVHKFDDDDDDDKNNKRSK